MPENLTERVDELSIEFDMICQNRHNMGAEKYGQGTFLSVDTLEMALHEIVDLANYARYTYIRVRLLQEQLGTDGTIATAVPGNETMGKAFDRKMEGFFNPYRKEPKEEQ